MPKKKITPAEEPEQTAGLMEQAGEEATAPPGGPPRDMGAPDGSPPLEFGDSDDAVPGDDPGLTGDGEGEAEEVMAVDAATPPGPLDSGPEEAPPMEPPDTAPGDGQPLDAQEPGPDGDKPAEDDPPTDPIFAQAVGDAPPTEPEAGEDTPPAPPLTERQSFFVLDFHELDRELSQEERQMYGKILSKR